MLPQILKRYDYAEIKKRMEAKGLALGEVLTREEALKDQQVAHNCASQPAYKRRYKRSVYCPFAHVCAAGGRHPHRARQRARQDPPRKAGPQLLRNADLGAPARGRAGSGHGADAWPAQCRVRPVAKAWLGVYMVLLT